MQKQPTFPSHRPAPEQRRFVSPTVEQVIQDVTALIADPELVWLFQNCYPNTLDTTVTYTEPDGKPDAFIITGDIDAMWLRDSTAQIWPYLPLLQRDDALRRLFHGAIARQVRCIQLDSYANAFYADPGEVGHWASDLTEMQPGIHERKWEIDSLCYPLRLSYGYWQETGDTAPFDDAWEEAADKIVQTFREQQRTDGDGPYTFRRIGDIMGADSPQVYGPSVRPVGLICSRFRPSDDPTQYQFLIPANFFAVVSLRQMAEMLETIRHRPDKAAEARALADEVAAALEAFARHSHGDAGTIYAYEVDGFGQALFMDDANVPSLLSLPYLGACPPDDPIYQATRQYLWSAAQPWFFGGRYAGIGSPHTGPDTIWPISLSMYGLTSQSETEVAAVLETLKATHAGTGFMHESFHKDDPAQFSRHWFAWANSLFGELVVQTAHRFPAVLARR